ncbi:MAG: hypothetical protein IJW67_09715 [Blautia sp.]|nr:hypothetical protein [Blautia sp.]
MKNTQKRGIEHIDALIIWETFPVKREMVLNLKVFVENLYGVWRIKMLSYFY